MRTREIPFELRLVALAWLAGASLFAADPVSPPDSLKYRRVYVPADVLNSQAKGMIPLKREEFERRVLAWTASRPNAQAAQVRVNRATYSVRLIGDQLVDGNARLEVASATSEPAVLMWESTLPLGKPVWDEQPPRPARLGTAPGKMTVLLVEKSGTLTFPWTLRGKTAESQETSFDLQLPKSAMSQLVLQLPAGLVPETDAGLVSQLPASAAENQLLPATTVPTTNWLIEFGGLTQLQLRTKNPAKIAGQKGLMLFRESATHLLSPVDLNSEISLQLDIHQTSLGSLSLDLDAKTRILGVRLGGLPLSWRETAATNPEHTTLQVDLPEPLTGSDSTLTVSALSPLPPNLLIHLPRLHLAGGTWQQGTATLIAPPAMQVGSLQFTEARQTSISPGSPTQPEQTYQFQYLSPLGRIAVQSAVEIPRLKIVQGLVVRHEATQLSALLNVDLAADSGQRFAVEGITSPDWIIDSVETSPPDLLEERQLVPIDDRKRTLRLRLTRPLTPKAKTRLVIRAHRQLPPEGESIAANSLRLVEFQEVREEQLVAALRATDSSREFQLSGELDSLRIDPESAAPEELSLLESSAAGLLFRFDRQGEGARVLLAPSDPRFTAAIESSALAQRGKIQHHAIARITPNASNITRLMVRSSGPVPSAMRWKLLDAGDLSIASQTLLPTQAAAADGPREVVWELVFGRMTSQPLTLEATWETPFSQRDELPLLTFPEAAAQDGLVRVETEPGFHVSIETAGVKAVPSPLAPGDSVSSIRGIFRYEPGRRATVALHVPPKDDALPAAWANSCDLQSRFSLDGAATHEITWRLENHGLDRFGFSLPAGIRPAQITLDGTDAPIPPLDVKTQEYFVPLPSRRRYPVINLTIATRAPESAGILQQQWSAPLVTTQVPVLDRQWRIKLPPGFQRVHRKSLLVATAQPWYETWHAVWKARLGSAFSRPEVSDRLEFESPWSATDPPVIAVYAPDLVQSWSIALCIAAAALVAWLIPTRASVTAILAVLLASAALLLPSAWAPLVAGPFWGVLLGSLLALGRRQVSPRPTAPRSTPASTRTMMATGLAGSLLWMLIAPAHQSRVDAAPDDAADKAAATKIHVVVIPIDADQKPQGDYVYVPVDFYTLLYKAPERERMPAWLLRLASYEVDSAADSSAASIVMRIELETLVAQAKVALPLRRGEIHLLEGQATLDGEPRSLDWDEAGTSLNLEVERPGVYQLAIAFSVAAKSENGLARWALAVPQVSRSSLRIKSPSRPDDWLLADVAGAWTKSESGDDLLAELGPAASLNFSRKDLRRPAENMTEAEQFVWWKVRPGNVTAEVLVRLRPIAGKISELRLRIDPQLRLLPLENEPRVTRTWLDDGDPGLVRFSLAEPAAQPMELRMKFLLAGSSGVGKLILPRIEVLADRRNQMWQAISVGKDSEITADAQIPIRLHPPVDFVDSIGGASGPPNLAFESTGPSPAFLIRPKESVVRARETIQVSLGEQDAEILYRADLSGIPPHQFQEVVELPPGFQVRLAALQEQDASVSLRPSSPQQGLLTLHRSQTPSASQQLVIEGTLPLKSPVGQPSPIRLPTLRTAASDGATVRIYRTPATLAAITSATGMQPTPSPEGAPWDPRLGHLLASYKSAPASGAIAREIAVQSRPNLPQANYRLVTKMDRTSPRSWSAVVSCDVTIGIGSLDAVRLEIPAEWSGPFELTPPMAHQVVLLPGQTQRHLIVRPVLAAGSQLSFSVRGPLKLQTGETPHAPVILPVDAAKAEAFLLLPSRVDKESLQWQTSGLQAMVAGEARDARLAADGHEVFRVVAPRFAATLLQSKDSRASARVVLADVLAHPRPGGGFWARVTYYVLPGGRSEAELQLPADVRLVQVLVNDSAADLRGGAGGSWKIPFSHEQLPQQVTAIYESPAGEPAEDGLPVSAPHWRGMTTEKTNWTLLLDSDTAATMPRDRDDAADPRSAPLSRMEAIIRLVRDAGDNGITGLPPPQLAAWLSLWRLEFARAGEAAQRSGSAVSGEMPTHLDSLETERRSLDAEFAATLSRYSDLQIASRPPTRSAADSVPGESAKAVVRISPYPLALPTEIPWSDFLIRLAMATFLIVCSALAALLFWKFRLVDSLVFSPAYLLALLAAMALLLLPAGPLAATLFALATLWFTLRRTWPGDIVDTGSRILRSGTSARSHAAKH